MVAKKKTGKPPAYQYYPDDFEQGTATFTNAQVGAYTRLLNYQWSHGSIPGDDVESLARIMRISTPEADQLWRTIRVKFPLVRGRFRNRRMEKERRKQRTFRQKQAINGQKGGRPPKNPGLSVGFHLGKPKHKAKKSPPSPSVDVRTYPPKPSRKREGSRTRNVRTSRPTRHTTTGAIQQQKTLEVQRLIAGGMSRAEANAQVFR